MEVTEPPLLAGRVLDLPGRGATFVRVSEAPPGAPTLLLLHGLGATADLNWFTAYPSLARRFGIVAIDHRGHGRGIRSSRRFRLTDCADDAAAALAALGIRRAICVGYSMGGPIAQLIWRRHPGRVDGLVMCATSRNFAGSPYERLGFGAVGGIAALARVAPPRAIRTAAGWLTPVANGDHPLSEWAAAELRRGDARVMLEAASAIGRYSSHRWIGKIDVPTAVVVTRHDQLVPARRQQKLAWSIPGATVHEVDGDHLVCGLAPERFVPPLVEACASVARRAGYTV